MSRATRFRLTLTPEAAQLGVNPRAAVDAATRLVDRRDVDAELLVLDASAPTAPRCSQA